MTNSEGLTWEEWARAAWQPDSFGMYETLQKLYDARNGWRGGEDPTEWRASND